MSPANQLRALIAAQLFWVVPTGIAARAERWAVGSEIARWLLVAAAIGLYPMLFGVPILAWRAASRAGSPVWKFSMVVAIEAALAFALLIALMPAVQ